MLIAMTKQTNVTDTVYEYDANGKMTHKVVTETLEIPDMSPVATVTTCACDCDDDFEADMYAEFEVPVSPLEVITAAAGIASIIASGCLIYKALRK